MRLGLLAVTALLAFAPIGPADEGLPTCPVCGEVGVPLVERDQLSAPCECDKWKKKPQAALVFADCSSRECQESPSLRPAEQRVYVPIDLYRCPHDGLLFTWADE